MWANHAPISVACNSHIAQQIDIIKAAEMTNIRTQEKEETPLPPPPPLDDNDIGKLFLMSVNEIDLRNY